MLIQPFTALSIYVHNMYVPKANNIVHVEIMLALCTLGTLYVQCICTLSLYSGCTEKSLKLRIC